MGLGKKKTLKEKQRQKGSEARKQKEKNHGLIYKRMRDGDIKIQAKTFIIFIKPPNNELHGSISNDPK